METVPKRPITLLIIIVGAFSGCMSIPFIDDPSDHPCDAKYNFLMHPRDRETSLKACDLISNWSIAGSIDTTPLDKSSVNGSDLGMIRVKYKTSLLSLPGWSGVEIRGIDGSTELEAIKETDYWVYVKTPEGEEGWIAKKWIKD